MRIIGRILVRDGKTVGLFFPMGESAEPGLYDLIEIMGEMTIRRAGDSAMDIVRLNALTPDGLHAEAFRAMLTNKEFAEMST